MPLPQRTKLLVDALKDARAIIEDPAKWTRGKAAADASGRFVQPTARDAVCWCVQGALERAYGGMGTTKEERQATWDAFDLLDGVAADMDPEFDDDYPEGTASAWFNDHHSHDEVLALIDRAIQKAATS
jgi:hypothetical protein